MVQRERDIQVKFRVTQKELGFIAHKAQQLGTRNWEAYLRKMAIDGLVIKLDIPELKEMIHLLRKMATTSTRLPNRSTLPSSCTRRIITTSSKAWTRSGIKQMRY